MAGSRGLRLRGVQLERAGSVLYTAIFFACILSTAAADEGDCGTCLIAHATSRTGGSAVTKAQCDKLAALITNTMPGAGNAFACISFSGSVTPELKVCASTLDAKLVEDLVGSFKQQGQEVGGSPEIPRVPGSFQAQSLSTLLDMALPGGAGTGQRTLTLDYPCLGWEDDSSTTKSFIPPPVPEPLTLVCMTALTTTRKASSGAVSRAQCNDLGARVTSDWAQQQLPAFTGAFICADISGSSAPQLRMCSGMPSSSAKALMASFRAGDPGTAEALSKLMDQALPDAGGPNRIFTLAYSCVAPIGCDGVPSDAAVVATEVDMLDGPTCNLCLTVSITARVGQPAVSSAQCSALANSLTVDWLSRGLVAAFRCSSVKGTDEAPELKLCSAVPASVAPKAKALFEVDAASIKKAMTALLTKALKNAGGASRNYKLAYTCGSGGASGSATLQGPASASCTDTMTADIVCDVWASRGECQTSKEYMMKNCAKSCGACSDCENTALPSEVCNQFATFYMYCGVVELVQVHCASTCGLCY